MPPVPKKKHSKARSRRRSSLFANRFLNQSISISICSHCGEPKPPHQVCPNCGHHKGREFIAPKERSPRVGAE